MNSPTHCAARLQDYDLLRNFSLWRGPGGKIFPATYSGGVYATETRRTRIGAGEAKEVECVLIDSVQAQSNRAEESLKAAIERGKNPLPTDLICNTLPPPT